MLLDAVPNEKVVVYIDAGVANHQALRVPRRTTGNACVPFYPRRFPALPARAG